MRFASSLIASEYRLVAGWVPVGQKLFRRFAAYGGCRSTETGRIFRRAGSVGRRRAGSVLG